MSFITGDPGAHGSSGKDGKSGSSDQKKLGAPLDKLGSAAGLQSSDFPVGGKPKTPDTSGTGGLTPDPQGKAVGGGHHTDEPQSVQNVFKPHN